jgi:hypothetical protein
MELSWQYFRFYRCSNRTVALWLPVIVRGVVFFGIVTGRGFRHFPDSSAN